MGKLFLKKHIPVLFLAVVLTAMAVLAVDTAYLTVDLTAKKRNHIEVFWAGEDQPISKKRSLKVVTRPGRNRYVIPLKDAISLRVIRVDLQQGKGKRKPSTISLHHLSIGFKWFFHGIDLMGVIENPSLARGMERNPTAEDPDELLFLGADPRLEFELDMKPKYLHLIIPLIFMLFLHLLISTLAPSARKNRYIIDLELHGSGEGFLERLTVLMKDMKLSWSMNVSHFEQDRIRLQFEVDLHSVSSMKAVIQEADCDDALYHLSIVAKRGGISSSSGKRSFGWAGR